MKTKQKNRREKKVHLYGIWLESRKKWQRNQDYAEICECCTSCVSVSVTLCVMLFAMSVSDACFIYLFISSLIFFCHFFIVLCKIYLVTFVSLRFSSHLLYFALFVLSSFFCKTTSRKSSVWKNLNTDLFYVMRLLW